MKTRKAGVRRRRGGRCQFRGEASSSTSMRTSARSRRLQVDTCRQPVAHNVIFYLLSSGTNTAPDTNNWLTNSSPNIIEWIGVIGLKHGRGRAKKRGAVGITLLRCGCRGEDMSMSCTSGSGALRNYGRPLRAGEGRQRGTRGRRGMINLACSTLHNVSAVTQPQGSERLTHTTEHSR